MARSLIEPRPKLHWKETRILASCAEAVRNRESDSYRELWEIDYSLFCISEVMFAQYEKQISPLMPAERKLYRRREGLFIFFRIKRADAGPMRNRLQGLGARARRKDRIQKAEGHHLESHYKVLWEIQGGRCYFSGASLGESFETGKYSIDHLIPLACRSWPYADIPGTNWPTNLALVTVRVNKMKGGERPEEFLSRIRRNKSFVPRPTTERRAIDRIREARFAEYVTTNARIK